MGKERVSAMPGGTISSKLFWNLIDRWGVADEAALALIGHAGGLTKRGTRPRFTLAGEETQRMANLLAIDRLLTDIAGEPGPWLRRSQAAAPFARKKPLDFMIAGGVPAIDATRRHLEKLALKKSL
jgi:hypothetical protein